jgi:endonuclease/exonuclease/phosphatase family metal-dependent hydrolase
MKSLRVLTYNIQFGRGIDRAIDLDRLAAAIRPFDPDVLALQEVDIDRARSGFRDQAQYLADQLGLTLEFAAAIQEGSERCGNATLTRLPIVRTRQVRLSRRTPASEPRCALVTRLAWGDTELDMVNTHLTDALCSAERQTQVNELLQAIGADRTILCGDLNCTPWSRPFRTLARQLRPIASPLSWPAPLPVIPLDHIFIRGDLHVVRSGLWRGPGARRASDHVPVFAELGRGNAPGVIAA